MNTPPCALIAEDEHVLARGLLKALNKQWPALKVCAVVHDGEAAIQAAQLHLPDIVFLDIQMPECNGLDAAERIVDAWPGEQPLPLLVFVTAFDRFAIDAFEREALDYVLKPVDPSRLALTCERLQRRLCDRSPLALEPGLPALRNLLLGVGAHPVEPLTTIQAGAANVVHMVPLQDVHFLEADDKYVRVATSSQDHYIRTPLRELGPRLDPRAFTQIHRSVIVRTELIDRIVRDDMGRLQLQLKGRSERFSVSRTYAHQFKPM